ncbi:MAG: hypothetical protein ACLP5H_02145 [Desulfomonilaceae bacterium]
MKILVDGCIFSESVPTSDIVFWTAAIPCLAEDFPGHVLYFLNRDSVKRFQDTTNLKNLWAPRPLWEQAAQEDRRLAALCQELGIEVFVSTYATSAGARVPSLFIAVDMSSFSSDGGADHELVTISLRRAAKLANRSWEVPQTGSGSVKQSVHDLERELRNVFESQPDEESTARLEAAETLVVAQARQLRNADLQKAIETRCEWDCRQPFAGLGALRSPIIRIARVIWRCTRSFIVCLRKNIFRSRMPRSGCKASGQR